MSQKNSGFEIKAEQRQSWLSIAMVWAGGMICVPCLMIGGVLVSGGLSFGQIIASVLLGLRHDLRLHDLHRHAGLRYRPSRLGDGFGRTGRKRRALHHFRPLLAIACIGWFGIQSATCGSAFASLGANMLGYESASQTAVTICSHRSGAPIMLRNGLPRLQGAEVAQLHRGARCWWSYACTASSPAWSKTTAASALAAYAPEAIQRAWCLASPWWWPPLRWAALISADYCRFAKSRGDVVKSSIVGVIPAGLFMLLTGGADEHCHRASTTFPPSLPAWACPCSACWRWCSPPGPPT